MSRCIAAWLVVIVSIAGCAQYAPATLDPKTGQYNTYVEIDKSAYREYVTDVDPRSYRFVALDARSNVYPARFEFFVRKALADLGSPRVLNVKELVQLVRMHPQLQNLTSVSDPLTLKRISEVTGPTLLVMIDSLAPTGAARLMRLEVTDAASGRVLLRLEQRKTIWMDADAEVNLPLLNALRQWYLASTGKPA